MNQYEGIVEVQTLTWRRVNRWLGAGYRLLSVDAVTTSGQHPQDPPGSNAGGYFVRRSLRFVVGRTADVEAREWKEDDHD